MHSSANMIILRNILWVCRHRWHWHCQSRCCLPWFLCDKLLFSDSFESLTHGSLTNNKCFVVAFAVHRYERTKIDLPTTNIFNFYFNSYFNGLKINIVPYVKGATFIVHRQLCYIIWHWDRNYKFCKTI
jgi:hypothetical protein